MDDGASPAIGLIVFLGLVIINGSGYGFLTALEEVSEGQVQKRAEAGSKHAAWLLAIMDSPYKVKHAVQILVTFVSGVFGIYQIRLLGDVMFRRLFLESQNPYLLFWCYVLAALAGIFIFVVLGIIAPQKVAARKPEKWLFRLAGAVHGLLYLVWPYAFLAEKLSNLAVRLVGIDPNASFDDVTEEEIISMVNEGHEQGVLQASEAEMIHNIFAFDDKEAKDIMTHRKHVNAIEGGTLLKEALEIILEGNNSRFPVYKGDIDNIIGILHMKDVMIESRKGLYLDRKIQEIPGLVREVAFIPETRNINELFKGMQSKKNHMVVVVDEYGQTAGIVAMEDILEEIVGNIFDEYDEEETDVACQADGSYLIRGMAPFGEVCETLHISAEGAEYETLSGYLISLISKIPGEHEQFELDDQGWHFHVLSVRDKMIHMVKVTEPEGAGGQEENRRKEEK